MTSYNKLIQKMKNAPMTIRFDEIEKVLRNNGFVFTRQKGSHVVFRNEVKGTNIVIPKKNPVKECYVEDVLRRISKDEDSK